jgi:hypothetical protein
VDRAELQERVHGAAAVEADLAALEREGLARELQEATANPDRAGDLRHGAGAVDLQAGRELHAEVAPTDPEGSRSIHHDLQGRTGLLDRREHDGLGARAGETRLILVDDVGVLVEALDAAARQVG